MPSPPRTFRHHRTAIAHQIGHNRRRRTCDRKCDFNGGIVTSAKDLAPQAWTERVVRYERALNARAGHSARPRRLIWASENSRPAGAARARSQRRGSGRRCGWRAARRVGVLGGGARRWGGSGTWVASAAVADERETMALRGASSEGGLFTGLVWRNWRLRRRRRRRGGWGRKEQDRRGDREHDAAVWYFGGLRR